MGDVKKRTKYQKYNHPKANDQNSYLYYVHLFYISIAILQFFYRKHAYKILLFSLNNFSDYFIWLEITTYIIKDFFCFNSIIINIIT